MSYDVTVGGEWINHTSNMAALFDDFGVRVPQMHGRPRREVGAEIGEGIRKIVRARREDGFSFDAKYNSPNGWGCRSGGLCAGKAAGQTCKQASFRYRSDRTYRRLVDSGASIEEQAMPEGGVLPAVTSKRPVQNAAGRLMGVQPMNAPEPLHTVPAAVEPTPAPKVARDRGVAGSRGPVARPVTDRLAGKHGTSTGYQYGCRDDCPGGPDGRTCRQAYTDYRREHEAKKRAAATPQPVNGTPEAVTETPGTETVPDQTETGPEETTALAEDAPNVAPDRTPELEEALAELRATHPPKIGPYRDDQWPGNDGPVDRDPTHGQIDRDIQLTVDEMQPASVGQCVAIERTLQDRRETEPPSTAEETPALAETEPVSSAHVIDTELGNQPTPPRHASRVTLHINGVPQDTEPGPITVTTSDPWTGHPLPDPTEGPRRSPHPTTPFDRRHRHTVLQHLVFPFLRALWLEAVESAQADQ